MVAVHLHLANANYDAVGAFAQLLPGMQQHAVVFADVEDLQTNAIPSVVAILKKHAAAKKGVANNCKLLFS